MAGWSGWTSAGDGDVGDREDRARRKRTRGWSSGKQLLLCVLCKCERADLMDEGSVIDGNHDAVEAQWDRKEGQRRGGIQLWRKQRGRSTMLRKAGGLRD